MVTALCCQGSLAEQSHPALRQLPEIAKRSLGSGPGWYVDAARGEDANPGTAEKPWRTLHHALAQLKAGDTLHLRGGTYYETITCSLAGTAEKPITIRSFPGERAIIDGGYREFFEKPAESWVPFEGGAAGEYRSARPYRNITGVAGAFGDSNIGLLTYWQLDDLRSTNETWRMNPEKKIMDLNLYCGPGVWYDQRTGFIHCRLAHTHNNNPDVPDYRGETDPRKLSLLIAPLSSLPLRIEQARHVRFQDLVLRGSGEETILIQCSSHVELDGVIVQCGGIDGRNSGHVKITNSAVFGRIPPWMWRIDSSKGCASGASRDIARMLTPVLLETSLGAPPFVPRGVANDARAGLPDGTGNLAFQGEDGTFPQMTGYPANHDWEVAHCEFTDGHDGVFWIGENMKFHHNLVENMQDDSIDISGPRSKPTDTMFVHENLFRRFVSGISTHNYYNAGGPRGKAWIFRNVIDMSEGVMWIRKNDKHPQGELRSAVVLNLHGADSLTHIESIYLYQNTILGTTMHAYGFAHGFLGGTRDGSERRVFNNLFVYLDDKGRYPPPFHGVFTTNANLQVDGNVHWNPNPAAIAPTNYLSKLRSHVLAERNGGVFGAHDSVGDPKLDANRYAIGDGSAAIGAGIVLPEALVDPLRPPAGKRPDAGAVPHDGESLRIGIKGRVLFGGAGAS